MQTVQGTRRPRRLDILSLVGLTALLLSLPLLASPAHAAEWKKITDRDGIQVFVDYDENSRLKKFRGVTVMSLDDEYAMMALYNDTPAFPKWLHLITGAQLIRENTPLDRDYRFVIHTLWPIKDRDVTLNSKLVHVTERGNESVTAYLNSDPTLLPVDDDYIRIPELEGIFSFKRIAPGKVETTYQISIDFGGWIPNWMVNIAMRDTPYFTLLKLRRLVQSPEYQNQYFSYIDLIGPGRPANAPPVKSWIYHTGLDPADEPPATQTP